MKVAIVLAFLWARDKWYAKMFATVWEGKLIVWITVPFASEAAMRSGLSGKFVDLDGRAISLTNSGQFL